MSRTAAVAAPEDELRLPAAPQPPASRALSLDLSVQDLLRQKRAIAELMKEVLIKDTHYGASFPGDSKQNLLQPGADALIVSFGLVPRFTHTREDIAIPGEGMHREYTFTCTLFTRAGVEVGSGIGSCSTMESKYRWRNDKRKCPACDVAALVKVKRGSNAGGYWCAPDKGGCDASYKPRDEAIEGQITGKVPNPDIADTYNTVLKIGTKRAKVAATIAVTGCSDMFTQDVEDLDAKIDDDTAAPEATKPSATNVAPPAPPTTPTPAAEPPSVDALITTEYAALQMNAGKAVAAKFWNQWKKADQKPARLDAMQRANVAIKAITDRLGAKAESLLSDILLNRREPDDVPGILADLVETASPPKAAAPPAPAADNDQPPY